MSKKYIDSFAEYYCSGHGAWGSLHIVLSDDNLEDHSVAFCKQYAHESGDVAGEELADILLGMNVKTRETIDKRVKSYISKHSVVIKYTQ